MGYIHIFEKSGDSELRRFEDSLKMAKEGIMDVCDLYEDMKAQLSERRGYSRRDEYGDMEERRGRYRMGR